jgi:hypothetical protein
MPQIPRLRPLNADTVAAQQRSQPLAWMQHALTVIKTSL